MHFRNYGLRKTWLDQRLKRLISEDPSKSNMENVPKCAEILMKAPLPYLLIVVNAIDSQKVSVSDIQNLMTVS